MCWDVESAQLSFRPQANKLYNKLFSSLFKYFLVYAAFSADLANF